MACNLFDWSYPAPSDPKGGLVPSATEWSLYIAGSARDSDSNYVACVPRVSESES